VPDGSAVVGAYCDVKHVFWANCCSVYLPSLFEIENFIGRHHLGCTIGCLRGRRFELLSDYVRDCNCCQCNCHEYQACIVSLHLVSLGWMKDGIYVKIASLSIDVGGCFIKNGFWKFYVYY
jgi:hypothetical protein